MSVTLVGIKSEGRSANYNNEGHRTYERTYIVRTDDKTDDAVRVLRCVGVPRLYFPWVAATESDTDALCTELAAEQLRESPYYWEVKATYSTDNKKQDPQQNEPPLKRPARITFTHVMRQKIYEGSQSRGSENIPDHSPDPAILNIVGFGPSNQVEVFDPPVLIDEAIPVLTIQRYEQFINPQIISQYVNTVNEDVFFTFAPRTCKLNNITVDVEIEEMGQRVRQVTYEIHHRPESWDLRILDVGTKYWSGNGVGQGSLVEHNESGEQTKFLLNGKGGKLDSGKEAVFIRVKCDKNKGPYKTQTFANLNLPQTL